MRFTRWFIPAFICAVWVFSLSLEGYSCTRIRMEKEARLNRTLKYSFLLIRHGVEAKYEEAAKLTDSPKSVMSDGEMFVLNEHFDYDRSSIAEIERYYRKLKALGVAGLPPLWDPNVRSR